MKRIALLLALALLLTACAAAPAVTTAPPATTAPADTAPPTTVPVTTAPAETAPQLGAPCAIDGDLISVGNLAFRCPDGFTAEIVNENAIILKNADRVCGVTLFAANVADLDEDAVRYYVPMQAESFLTQEVVRDDATVQPMTVGGIDVDFQVYGEMFADLSTQMVIDATFTDSWYAYTIKMVEPITEDYDSTNITSVMTALVLATYTGPDARFDFVQ